MEAIREQERLDGVRFVWNYWPSVASDSAKSILPLGVFLTPFKTRPDLPVFKYEPIRCTKCRAVLNPFCQADFYNKTWICCLCTQRNMFPSHYDGISEQQRPPEMVPQFCTMEYTLPRQLLPAMFLFVVDTCMDIDDLKSLKTCLSTTIAELPQEALVGLITFNRTISIYDLSMDCIKHSFILRGSKDFAARDVQDQLGMGRFPITPYLQSPPTKSRTARSPSSKSPKTSPCQNRFVQPLSKCEKFLNTLVESISVDPWPTQNDKRPLRSTGSALSIAVSLLENCFPGTGARIMLFVGGPCTHGPGMVVGEDFKVPIRSYLDIAKGNAPFLERAQKFYGNLAERAVKNSHTIDVFSCALDQTGLHEMKVCCDSTGGQMLLGDGFNSTLFSQNLQIFFSGDASDRLQMAFNAILEVKASRNIKVSGCLGQCSSLDLLRQETGADPSRTGTDFTEWKCCSLAPGTTLCFTFDTEPGMSMNEPFYLQFITKYQHASGQKIVRVTTANRSWVSENSPNIAAGFDQEAAVALIARMAVIKADAAGGGDVQRWIDRTLIRLCNKFGSFRADDPLSFSLPDTFSHLPSTIFHLRRSQLLQIANTSPDESAFYRHCLMKQDVISSLIMIQPVLYAYSLQGPPTLVSLDSSSLQPDSILLLDTFFHIVIYRGETIMHWVNAGYDKMPEYAHLAHLLEAPVEDSKLIFSTRFPMPRYVITEQGGSQARFLLSKVNPSTNQTSIAFSYPGQEPQAPSILTEDVSLQVFVEHLRKLVVSSTLNS